MEVLYVDVSNGQTEHPPREPGIYGALAGAALSRSWATYRRADARTCHSAHLDEQYIVTMPCIAARANTWRLGAKTCDAGVPLLTTASHQPGDRIPISTKMIMNVEGTHAKRMSTFEDS